jgi:Leucine-rich repeat (LRR) protein
VSDLEIVQQFAGGRAIVDLAHARERSAGQVGVLWRDGAAMTINAYRCELAAMPEIAALASLERLDLGDNLLVELPALPRSLRELYVHDNQLSVLPALPRLTVLDANRNRLAALPSLDGLDFVYAAGNELTALPSHAGVRYLNASDNPLGILAIESGSLVELRVENAELRSATLDHLHELRELSLRGNALVTLPSQFFTLDKLELLDLRGNELDEVPDLRRLPLRKLDLRWNPLRRPPSWLDDLAARGCRVYI